MPKRKKPEDPKQIKFLTNYHDPKSPTFGDVKNSALGAGYSDSYSDNLSGQMPKWLSDNISHDKLLKKAEKNLEEFLDMDIEEPVIGIIGPLKDDDGNVLMKRNANILRSKLDATKFVAAKSKNSNWNDDDKPQVTVNINFNDIDVNNYVDFVKGKVINDV